MVVVQNEIWVVDKRSQLHLETVSVCGNGVLKLQFTEAQGNQVRGDVKTKWTRAIQFFGRTKRNAIVVLDGCPGTLVLSSAHLTVSLNLFSFGCNAR